MRLLQRMAGRATAAFRSVLDDLVTTAFPSDCRVCNGPLLRSTFLPICDICRTSVPPQTLAMCRICGEALDIDMESARFASQFMDEGLLCDDCRNRPPKFERAVAYAVYRKELREMIHLLKYERMGGVAKLLGPMLAEAILSIEAETAQAESTQELIVVPVPLFPSKLRHRGYNQSELLAKAALAELQRTRPAWRLSLEPAILRRRRDTRSQFALNPTSRYWNVKGAFAVDRSSIRPGCEVLLIDDIYTTGATARECSRALRRAGAGKVWVATLARAQTPRIPVAMWDETRSHSPQGFR
jgi:ComF family protein